MEIPQKCGQENDLNPGFFWGWRHPDDQPAERDERWIFFAK